MNVRTLAIALIVLGIVVLAYSGLTFKTRGKPIDFLGIHVEAQPTATLSLLQPER